MKFSASLPVRREVVISKEPPIWRLSFLTACASAIALEFEKGFPLMLPPMIKAVTGCGRSAKVSCHFSLA